MRVLRLAFAVALLATSLVQGLPVGLSALGADVLASSVPSADAAASADLQAPGLGDPTKVDVVGTPMLVSAPVLEESSVSVKSDLYNNAVWPVSNDAGMGVPEFQNPQLLDFSPSANGDANEPPVYYRMPEVKSDLYQNDVLLVSNDAGMGVPEFQNPQLLDFSPSANGDANEPPVYYRMPEVKSDLYQNDVLLVPNDAGVDVPEFQNPQLLDFSPSANGVANEPLVYYRMPEVKSDLYQNDVLPAWKDWTSMQNDFPSVQNEISTNLNTQNVPNVAVDNGMFVRRQMPVVQAPALVPGGQPLKPTRAGKKPQTLQTVSVVKKQSPLPATKKLKQVVTKNTAKPVAVKNGNAAKIPGLAKAPATSKGTPAKAVTQAKPATAKGKAATPAAQKATAASGKPGVVKASVAVAPAKAGKPARGTASVALTAGKPKAALPALTAVKSG